MYDYLSLLCVLIFLPVVTYGLLLCLMKNRMISSTMRNSSVFTDTEEIEVEMKENMAYRRHQKNSRTKFLETKTESLVGELDYNYVDVDIREEGQQKPSLKEVTHVRTYVNIRNPDSSGLSNERSKKVEFGCVVEVNITGSSHQVSLQKYGNPDGQMLMTKMERPINSDGYKRNGDGVEPVNAINSEMCKKSHDHKKLTRSHTYVNMKILPNPAINGESQLSKALVRSHSHEYINVPKWYEVDTAHTRAQGQEYFRFHNETAPATSCQEVLCSEEMQPFKIYRETNLNNNVTNLFSLV